MSRRSSKNGPVVPKGVIRAASRGTANEPFSTESERALVTRANEIFDVYIDTHRESSKGDGFYVLTLEEVQRRSRELSDRVPKNSESKAKELGIAFFHDFYTDQINVAALYQQLNINRGSLLLGSFTRNCYGRDLFGMALAGRALLELGVVAADSLRIPLGVFEKIISLPGDSMPIFEDMEDAVEKTLLKAIWGTRIGSSDLGDGSRRKKKPGTPLWDYVPVPSELRSKNILASFQGRGRRQPGERGG